MDVKTIPKREKRDKLISSASPIKNAAAADVEVERGPLNSEIPEDEEDWTMGNLVEAHAEERVGVNRRLRDLQKSCRVKVLIVPGCAVESVGLAVELADDTVVTSPSAVGVADPRIDELSVELASTRAEVILLTSKVYNLEEVRDKVRLEHENFL